ncbi:MAG TPA: TraR/DksA C4-type zinc finger protein [Tepidisphaeraceae bacterium]|nr:TraR/DksA C4-type zinc finger protein [Tepidisphaeraceae bacterium]
MAKSTQKKASKSKGKRVTSGRATPERTSAKSKSGAKAAARSMPARGESRGSNGRGAAKAKGGIDRVAAGPVAVVPQAVLGVPGKPVKNQAGLKSRELEFFRDLLIAKRRELLGDVHSMEEEALRSASGSNLSNLPIHMADMGTDNYEQEFTLGLVEKDRQLLREINVALGKIRDGTYGICEGTGKPITKARLEAKPWAKYSIEYTRKMESRMLPRG